MIQKGLDYEGGWVGWVGGGWGHTILYGVRVGGVLMVGVGCVLCNVVITAPPPTVTGWD